METILWILASLFTAHNIKVFISAILGFISYLIWWCTAALMAFLIVVSFDFILGFFIDIFHRDNTPNFKKFKNWLKTIILVLTAIIVGNQFDIVISWSDGLDFGVKWLIMLYATSHYTLSLLANMSLLGVPIPTKLISKIQNYKDSIDNNFELPNAIK